MRLATILGILLILLGVVSLATRGFNFKSREKVLDLGPIEATTEKDKHVNLPPILGVVALAGGVLLVVADSRRQAS